MRVRLNTLEKSVNKNEQLVLSRCVQDRVKAEVWAHLLPPCIEQLQEEGARAGRF